MTIESKLQIILVTYNRKRHLEKTLEQLFDARSPVKDFDITIQDNRSDDGTSEIIKCYQSIHHNLRHIINKYNVGGDGNIVKAMESATYEYVWIICDDDQYDWTGWPEIEDAVWRGEKLICAATFNLKGKQRNDNVYQLHQMTFLPSIIFKTSLFNDTMMFNIYNSIFTHFAHLVPVVTHINHGGKIFVVNKGIVDNGRDCSTASLVRGAEKNDVFIRSKTIQIPVGFANIANNLKSRKQAKRCLPVLINGDHHERTGYLKFFIDVFQYLNGDEARMHVTDLYIVSPLWMRFLLVIVHFWHNTFVYTLLKGSFIAKMVNRRST